MAFSFSNKIAFKQARSVLIISLLLGLISTSVQINIDLRQERQLATEEISRYITLYKESASTAVYNLNEQLAQDTTNALISHPAIYQAELIDDFGEALAQSSRNPVQEDPLTSALSHLFFKFDNERTVDLTIQNADNGSAHLIIHQDTVYIASQFTHRVMTSLLLGLTYNILLAAFFLLLFYHYLSKPITRIAHWVTQLGNGSPDLDMPYTQNDEIGALVNGFNALWQERRRVTDQLNATITELSRSENFARSLMENAGDAMFLCQPDTCIIEINHQAADTLKSSKREILSQSLAAFSQEHSRDQLQARFDTITQHEPVTFEDVQIMADGQRFPVEARGIRITLEDQEYILILARDISARKQAEARIHELAFYDPLTGLANRRLFIDRLTTALEVHSLHQHCGAILYLDLDRFKTINDSLGHSIGDELLKIIARRLKSLLPDKATCARFGGDEFVILLPEAGLDKDHCAEASVHLANSILEQMAAPIEIDHHLLYCTTSIGITVFPASNTSAMDFLRHADTALYRAKALGRNDFQFFNPEMQSAAEERLEVEKGLYQALDNNEFELWYQPQMCCDQKIIGAEALVRWRHPTKGLIQPGNFIPVAEDSGQIVEIGFTILQQALSQLAQWQAAGLPANFRGIAINISPLQFMQVDFVDRLFALLDQYAVSGTQVELEITENMLLNNFEIASHKMNILKQRGISFAIDDFGTGYSSLKYLHRLPLDILKIDRSFVTGLQPESDMAAIVEVIIATADRLGLKVIAEGVETEAEQRALKVLGCDCYQGFLYHKPLPVDQFGPMLLKSQTEYS